MKPLNEKLRSRLQLSRSLFGIFLDAETILSPRTIEERKALEDTVFEMVPKGCMSFSKRMEETRKSEWAKEMEEEIEGDVTDQFIVSRHGVSLVDALIIAIEDDGQITLRKQVELFASLANILVEEIPHEIRWALDKTKDLEIEKSVDLIDITVHAVDAMHAIQEAWQRNAADTLSQASLEKKVAEVIREKARANGSMAHVRNRELKARVFEWCETNLSQYKSMDQAAEAIAGVEIQKAFTTVRSWIREWKKEQLQKEKLVLR